MIRYVVAVALVTALLGVGFAALEAVSTVRGETAVEGEIVAIENAAISLIEHDDTVPGSGNPPRRVLDIELPRDSFTSDAVDRLVFEPVAETNRTRVQYQFDGRSANTVYIDAPLVSAAADTETVDLTNSAGSHTIVLELTRDATGERVIETTVRRY